MIVVKVGGSVLKNPEDFLDAARRIREKWVELNEIPVIVVSAMKGVTDEIISASLGSVELLKSVEQRYMEVADELGSRKLAGRVRNEINRVPVLEGHSIAVFARLMKNTDPDEVIRAMESFKTNEIRNLELPTAPNRPIIVRHEVDRPQPRLDRKEGMAVVVGRIREDRALGGIKFFALGHNTIRGAAGTAVLIAELAVANNLL
jgi:aspartate-semialdehyde dehydrogenase